MSRGRHALVVGPLALGLGSILAVIAPAAAQEGVFLREAEAPAAVFAQADRFDRTVVVATPALRARMGERLAASPPSLWEDAYVVTRAYRGGRYLGLAVLVEEIGKHRPITFVVGVRPDGGIEDVAVVAYREAYGGEVRSTRFLRQYRGRRPGDDLRPYHGVVNIAGATLSVEAAGRAVRKAQALAGVLEDAAS